ncbi:DUF1127 domain-containing protein [Thalassococcus sp. S3]|uniref:DUF1127 domain-containing protein n=1 Tax=Thalassococcus sp. S3 TaxID=2017482 RepID=UPI0010247820|nr:DUF1127 domain-containing protein [Thalassococcus sp. S3]QBF30590.1 DUF1127 domain-containing protein [Thalassococcus sp. S3]
MAYTSTQTGGTSVFGLIGQFFSVIGNALVALGDANSKVRQLEALNALSDAELAERGLRREDIARTVFMNNYWA